MNAIVQCMGGWCRVRQQCAHYVAKPIPGAEPAERLCPKGVDQPEPIRPRFDAWLAGATAEQAERWKNETEK